MQPLLSVTEAAGVSENIAVAGGDGARAAGKSERLDHLSPHYVCSAQRSLALPVSAQQGSLQVQWDSGFAYSRGRGSATACLR